MRRPLHARQPACVAGPPGRCVRAWPPPLRHRADLRTRLLRDSAGRVPARQARQGERRHQIRHVTVPAASTAERFGDAAEHLSPPASPTCSTLACRDVPPIRPPATRRRIGRAELEASFDSSCRALGTDHVDLYLLHEEVPSALEPAAVDFLQELRASNRVRQLGLAANGSRYLDLEPADLAPWNVLQYEFGPAWPAHAGLLRQFPAKTHIFHSCLRGVSPTAASGTEPGRVLAGCLSANPSGRVLFSSTNLAHVRANLRVIGG